MSEAVETAKKEILRLHHEWFEANLGLQGDRLKHIMAGEKFYNYNLNGYTYQGLAELEKLWRPEHMPTAFDLRDIRNERNLRIEATEDIGWLTVDADCEMVMKLESGSGEMRGEGDVVVMPFRITEIFRRDDGRGESVWRMWHFHASQQLADGGPRFITE